MGTQGPSPHRSLVGFINLAGGDGAVHPTLQPPSVVQHPTELVQVTAGEDFLRLVHQGEHLQKLLLFGVDGLFVLLLNGEGEPGEAGEEEHQVVVEPVLPLVGDDDGCHLEAVLGEGDLVQSTVGGGNLVLEAAAFAAQLPLQVNGLLRQPLFVDVLPLEGIEAHQHRYGKGAACPQTGSGGKVGVIGKGQLPHIQELHRLPDSGMLNLIHRTDPLPLGVGDLVVVLKEGRQMTDMNITVFIDAGGDDLAAVLLIEAGEVGSAAEERYPEWRLGDDHFSFLPSIESGTARPGGHAAANS